MCCFASEKEAKLFLHFQPNFSKKSIGLFFFFFFFADFLVGVYYHFSYFFLNEKYIFDSILKKAGTFFFFFAIFGEKRLLAFCKLLHLYILTFSYHHKFFI